MKVYWLCGAGLMLALAGDCATAATALGPRFDLICAIHQHIDSPSAHVAETDGVQEYSFDLIAGVYCAGSCIRSSRLVDALPDRLVLRDEDKRDPVLGELTEHIEIDRRTGAYQASSLEVRLEISTQSTGQCRVAPFRPFPSSAF